MAYDPREHGCLCDSCPLGDGKAIVVPPEIRPGRPLCVGQEPGKNEERELKPFIGKSGKEFMEALRQAGLRREQVSITNARLCRLPNYKARVADDRRSLECCRPRLIEEMRQAPAVLLMGAHAFMSAVGFEDVGEEGLGRSRGFPIELDVTLPHDLQPKKVKTVATVHPAAVLRKRRLTEEYRSDVAKFIRHWRGALSYKEPTFIIDPTPEQLENVTRSWLEQQALVGVDIESRRPDGEPENAELNPLTQILRCVGFGTATLGICAGFESVEQPPRTFKCPPGTARQIIAAYFADPRARITGWNINSFDRPVLARFGMPLPGYQQTLDAEIGHHVVDAEMSHKLSYAVSRYTDAPRWKPVSHDAWDNDREYHRYCMVDCCNTATVTVPIAQQVAALGQLRAYQSDIDFQRVGAGMHEAGVYIDMDERRRHELRLEAKMEAARRAAVQTAPYATQRKHGGEYNPGSDDQVRDALFYGFRMAPTSYETDSGKPSTKAEALNEILDRNPPHQVVEHIEAVIAYRRAQKWKSTYIDSIVPGPDGRVHPNWSIHVQKVGRPSCSHGLHQLPGTKHDSDSMRSMMRAAPGNVLVYADMDQFHLRLVAGVARDEKWIETFRKRLTDPTVPDVHYVNASDFANKPISELKKHHREFAKTASYAILYHATIDTFGAALKRARDPATGGRPYANWTDDMFKLSYDSWLSKHPAIPKWWQDCIDRYLQRGYSEDYVLGRRHYFKDAYGGEFEHMKSDIVNFEILATEGALMGGHGAAGKLVDILPFKVYGPGLMFHWFDSLTVEVEARHVDRAKAALTEAMVSWFKDVPLTTTPKSGTHMHKVE